MNAHGPMPKSAWIFPALAVLLFAAATAAGYSFKPSSAGLAFAAVLLLILFGTVFAAVHHAEVVAERIGEPFGTLLLTLSVTIIEVALIATIMLGEKTRDHAGARYGVCGGDDRLQRAGRPLHPGRRLALPRAGYPGERIEPLSQRSLGARDHHADHAQLHADNAGAGFFNGATRLCQCRHHPALWRVSLYPDRAAPGLFRRASRRRRA